MRIAKNDVPVKLQVPGAVARLQPDFGDPGKYGTFSAEYFSLGADTDIAPLLAGLHAVGFSQPGSSPLSLRSKRRPPAARAL